MVACASGSAGPAGIVDVPGDVDPSAGPVVTPCGVLVHGSVRNGARLESQGTIRVLGDVEAAEISAFGDILVEGGIAGQDKSTCSAGGSVRARYLNNARIEAGGGVTADTEIVRCSIICRGALRVDDGVLVGGHVVANGGITCRSLGSASGAAIMAEVGIDECLRRAAGVGIPQIQADSKEAARIRQIVEPLMHNQKSLNAAQKEKATELLFAPASWSMRRSLKRCH